MSEPEAEVPDTIAHGRELQRNLIVALCVGIVATLAALWVSQDGTVEREAIIAAALFLLLGFMLALLVKTVVDVQADLLLTLVIFLPLLVFLILSGKIANFAAGGVNVTLVVPLNEVAIPNRQVLPDSSASRQHSKCEAQAYTNSPPQPVYLTLTLGGCTTDSGMGGGGYALADVKRWVDEDAAAGSFKFLIVVNSAGAFYADIDSLSVAKLLATDEGGTFVDAINDGSLHRDQAPAFPGIVFDAMPDSATNIEALQAMEARNLDALVVTYSDNHIKGVLSREQVLSSMMLALASSGE